MIEIEKRTIIEGNGTPLLLLHGAGGPIPVDLLRNKLTKYYRVFSPLLLGYYPGDGRLHYSDESLVQFIETIQTYYKIEKWIICGVSTGGRAVLNYLIDYQEKVSKAIVISSAGMNTIPPARIKLFNPIMQRLFSWVLSNPNNLSMLGDNEIKILNGTEVELSINYMKQFLSQKQLRDNFTEMMLTVLSKKQEWNQLLKSVKTPVCILWGDKDNTCPVAGAYALSKLLLHNSIGILKGYGHMAMMTNPEYFSEKIVEFDNNN
jgi:pimeloyl-ACP methyl ester carboxylesterase